MCKVVIGFFRQNDKYSVFSNWYRSDMIIDGVKFSSMEQWMMYSKAMLCDDKVMAKKILLVDDHRGIKAPGREVRPFDSKLWDEHKFNIVVKGLKVKFRKDGRLWSKLDYTGDNIIAECSPYDRICGIGMSQTNPNVNNPDKWLGQNLLGKALMQARNELREGI